MMFKWFINMKIGTKVTVIVALLMVVTLLIVGFISFNSASNALFKSYESSLTVQASQTAQVLGDALTAVRTAMDEAAGDVEGALVNGKPYDSLLEERKAGLGFSLLNYTNAKKTGNSRGNA